MRTLINYRELLVERKRRSLCQYVDAYTVEQREKPV